MPSVQETEKWISEVNLRLYAVEGKMSFMAQVIATEALIDEEDRKGNSESCKSFLTQI